MQKWMLFLDLALLTQFKVTFGVGIINSNSKKPKNYSIIHSQFLCVCSNDLIRVVTLNATVMAFGSLTYLVGCGVEGRLLLHLD